MIFLHIALCLSGFFNGWLIYDFAMNRLRIRQLEHRLKFLTETNDFNAGSFRMAAAFYRALLHEQTNPPLSAKWAAEAHREWQAILPMVSDETHRQTAEEIKFFESL